MAETDHSFALAKRSALAHDDKGVVVGDQVVSYVARPYIELSRLMLVDNLSRALAAHPESRIHAGLCD